MSRRDSLKLFDYNYPINIQVYDPILGAKEYRTISGALECIHPFTGMCYHLIIYQAVHMPKLLYANYVYVNDYWYIIAVSQPDSHMQISHKMNMVMI